MQRKIYLVILILFSASAVGAQETTSREQKIEELRIVGSQIGQIWAKLDELESRQQNAARELLDVSSQDKAESEKIGAEVVRLFPAGLLKNLIPSEDDTDFSAYSFDQMSDYHYAPSFRYENDMLVFAKTGNSFGLIGNLGGTFIETINEQNKEFSALVKYEIPKDFENIESEFTFNGVNFRNKLQIVVGNTYLVRAFNQWGNDGIFALRIHLKDSDESIVLFVKLIKDLSKPLKNVTNDNGQPNLQKPPSIPDYTAQQAVTNALIQKGFYNATVEATTTEITVRGTIPKGKMAELMQIATETAKRKVNNQVTEQ